jgi:phosphonate degradation associated HDIG domain protein
MPPMARPADPRARVVDEIFALLLASRDMPYIGEPISQLDHALQCADLAREAGAGDDLVAAALLHDIGHLCAAGDAPRMDGLGVAKHESIGADHLRALGLPESVADLVEGHVQAKRYLCSTTAGYADKLSAASAGTLVHQGGPMSPAEQAAFAADPRFKDKLRLRAWDEQAKRTACSPPDLASHRARLIRLLADS